MKTIKLSKVSIELDIWESLTVKDMRKIYPIIKNTADNEVEMVVQFIKALSIDPNIEAVVDTLSIEDFTKLWESIGQLLNEKKK
jgi:hypothetical protein